MLFYTNHFNWMERNLVLMKMVDQERPVVLECTGRNLIHRRAGIADCSYQTEYCWPTLEIQVHLQLEKVLAASSKKKKSGLDIVAVSTSCRDKGYLGGYKNGLKATDYPRRVEVPNPQQYQSWIWLFLAKTFFSFWAIALAQSLRYHQVHNYE